MEEFVGDGPASALQAGSPSEGHKVSPEFRASVGEFLANPASDVRVRRPQQLGGWPRLAFALPAWRREPREMHWLFFGLGASVLILAFLMLAGEVTEGDTQAFDVRILHTLRGTADPSMPIGPPWLQNSLLDLTALGGTTLLGLAVLSVAGFLFLQKRLRSALAIVLTSITGELLNIALKHAFNRSRPEVVSHLRDVSTASFPSGHAMESAIVYLTLGAMLMRVAERRATKLYCLGVATLLTVLAGVSRVYLGVHYPTDVVGGWIVGFGWASVCWWAAQQFEAKTPIDTHKGTSSQSGHDEPPSLNQGRGRDLPTVLSDNSIRNDAWQKCVEFTINCRSNGMSP